MSASKPALVAALRELALLMEFTGEDAFRCRAYEQGARVLEALDGDPEAWLCSGVLKSTRGIGKGLAEKIEEWCREGRLALLDELRGRVTPGMLTLIQVPGLGPKKIKALYEARGIDSIEKLEEAARAGVLNELPGFGAKSAEKILAGIAQRRQYGERWLAHEARRVADILLEHLRRCAAAEQLVVAGSLRRRLETSKDIDLLAVSTRPAELMAAFVGNSNVERVVNAGETKSSIVFSGGMPVDLRVVAPGQFAAALQYFTGSKEHNTELRARAKRLGLKLNEYGLFREAAPEAADGPGGATTAAEPLPAETEAELYAHLGLAYIEPELREGRGEISAAETASLPELVELADLRGVLHCHTTYSDGRYSVEELAALCHKMEFQYLVICDHSQSAGYAGGLRPDVLERQMDEIDRVNARAPETMPGFRIFKGIESDILGDGALDYDDALLARLDLVVASIHSRMQLDRAAMTERLCRALEHPATTILGHPSGRLLLRRPPIEADWDRVIETAARRRVVLEINTHPNRLDLDWRYIKQAKAAGCRFAINPDAHTAEDLTYLPYGVGIARKGWLTAGDVINTMDVEAFAGWLKTRKN